MTAVTSTPNKPTPNNGQADLLAKLFFETFSQQPQAITPLTAQGSDRKYFRLESPDNSAIATIGENIPENQAFIYISRHLSQKGINVPKIFAVSDDSTAYLQQDLGSKSLFDTIAQGRESGNFSQHEKELLAVTIASLPDFQFLGAQGLDTAKCYPVPAFDRRGVLWDLNYFKYCYLKVAAIDFDEPRLEDDFDTLADLLLDSPSAHDTLLYRDFQSRNVMIKDNRPWFIDFQGSRLGPVYYDLASFLWQARAKIPDDLRQELIGVYINSAKKYRSIDPDRFLQSLQPFVLFRQLQTMGAYGFRGLIEKRPHFLQSIPDAWRAISAHLSQNPALCSKLPYLTSLLLDIADSQRCDLTITIGSFSYKKGYPDDDSGNGGGFIFDCRGMLNPGRYEQYRPLTGRDLPVIQFLEERGEVQPFVDNVFSLVSPTIENYIKRRFTNLSIWFGCTGGQHRSVYCADRLARLLSQRFPNVTIRLIHRQQPQLSQEPI